jgi:cyclohexanecarboxylate-CoA ligase
VTVAATRPVVPSGAEADRRTIAETFSDAVRAAPQALAVVDGDVRLTLAQLAETVAAMADRLTAAGVRTGDVVTAQLPNRWNTIAAMHAVWSLGAVVNPVTTIYRGAELRTILDSSRPRAVLVPGTHRGVDHVEMATRALADVAWAAPVLAVVDGQLRSDPQAPAEPARDPADRVDAGEPADPADPADRVAMLMYTSGTTGHPKGVLHTHRTLQHEAASIAETFGLAGDAVFMPSPLTHVTGLLYGVLLPVQTGGHVVLQDRWDAEVARQTVEREHCTFTVSATPFLRGLTDACAAAGMRCSLRTFVCGGADIPAALVERAEAVMGITVARTYGSTEMPTLCIVRPDDPPSTRTTTEGRVIGAARARVQPLSVGPGSPDQAAPGETGELEVQGPELFVGYLDPADNAGAFTDDGWFRTGDLATIAATGEISIVGRLKDLIIRGGENISAKEVEDLLVTHPAVRDVAVVAVPDELMGERACAVVVSDDPELGLADLSAHLEAAGIARQKFPEALLVVADLPRTGSGKVQKYALRTLAAQAHAAGTLQTRR